MAIETFAFAEQLKSIQEEWTEEKFEVDPLDGDDVDKLTWIIKIQLNFLNGNITEEERQSMLNFNSEEEYLQSL